MMDNYKKALSEKDRIIALERQIARERVLLELVIEENAALKKLLVK